MARYVTAYLGQVWSLKPVMVTSRPHTPQCFTSLNRHCRLWFPGNSITDIAPPTTVTPLTMVYRSNPNPNPNLYITSRTPRYVNGPPR